MTDTENVENQIDAIEEEENEEDINPRFYELGYHIIPAISEEEAPNEAAAIKGFIQEHGGTVISEEAPKHVDLAYDMFRTENGNKEKFETAHFGGIKFEMDPNKIIEVKEVLDGNKNILRHIIFKTVKESTRAEIRLPQTQGRTERTDRKQEVVAPKAPVQKKEEENVPVSEKELDKSIEELVVE